jgi:hypothetical protein
MGAFSLQRPTQRSIRFTARIQAVHSLADARKKLRGIEKELKRIVRSYKKTAAKRRGARKR